MAYRAKRWCSLMLSAALTVSGIAFSVPRVAIYASEGVQVQEGTEETQQNPEEGAEEERQDSEPESLDAAAESQAETQAENTEYAKAVNFTKVKIDDAFWGSRQKQFICKVIPTAIANVEKSTGGIPNIKNAALLKRGQEHGNFGGAFYVDSDVHKVLESMCYALMIDPQGDAETVAGQNAIKDKLEEWIPYYVDAQEDDGYFDTYFTLSAFGGARTGKFTDFNLHELYCAGHFYEAAVAHYNATGGTDTRLLDMAVKNADYIASLFGVGKWKQVPGHQEIELALVKLADLCQEIGGDYAAKADTYTELAKFFLDTRGDHEGRHGSNHNSSYDQDHIPVAEQTKAEGHAVRAFYLYSGMVDVAMASGTDSYDNALLALWDDVAHTKTYVTGGVGAVASKEGFGDSYELPNDSAYNETCASIANMMWNERMGRYFDSSKYADEMERALYNGIISCVNLDGDKFFYGNPMQSQGGNSRSAWFGTACCPSNLVRFVESLGSYLYTQKGDEVTLNLYIGNEMNVKVGDATVALDVDTEMPWDGRTAITYHGDSGTEFALRLRIPYWAKGANSISVNGESISAAPDDKGYVKIRRAWNSGDKVEVSFAMEVERVYSDERVVTNEGLVAIQRGPLVYTSEGKDNGDSIFSQILSKDAQITAEKIDDIKALNKEYKEVTLNPEAADARYGGFAGRPAADVQGEWTLFDPEGKISIAANSETNKTEMKFGRSTRVKAIYNDDSTSEWSDYAVEAKLTLTDKLEANAGIVFRGDKETFGDGADQYNGYFIGIGQDGGNEGVIFGAANADKGWTRLDLAPIQESVELGKEYTLRVAVKDDLAAVYVNGSLVKVLSDPEFRYQKGTVGLRSYNQPFCVSEFTVRPLAAEDIPDLQGFYLPDADPYHVRGAVILHADTEVFDPSTWEYKPSKLTMVPYYTWQNRGAGQMSVYLQESKEQKKYGNIARYAKANASAVSIYDSIEGLNDGSDSRWTSYGKAPNPWVELEFPWSVILSGSRVKWYNDGGGVQVPDGLAIEYWDGESYVPVTQIGEYNRFQANTFNTYEFEQIETTKLRMQIKNDVKNVASGIMEWEVVGDISPIGISLDQEKLGMGIGESRYLTAAVKPSASEAPLTWTSDHPEIAAVENGLVTAVSAGEAIITAETVNHLKATCAVVVVDTSDLEAAVKAAADAAAAAKAEAQKALEAAQAAEKERELAQAETKAAKAQAEAAKGEAQKAEAAKVLAEIQSKAAQAEAKAAKEQAEAAKAQAEAAKAQNDLAKAQVELAKGEAATAKSAAEEAKAAKVLAEAEAAAAKAEAEAAKTEAKAAKAEAAAAKAEAAAAKAEAAAAKAEAEAAKKLAAEATKACHVTFASGGGTKVAAQTVIAGTTVAEPKDPVKKGYLFVGWYQDGKAYDFETKVTQDLTLAAKWKKVKVAAVSITKVQNKASQRAVVQIKKVSGAKGYQFLYTADKKFKKGVKKASGIGNKLTLKNLKKGKTYYIKVRAYAYDSQKNKVYGKYSKVKKAVIKK